MTKYAGCVYPWCVSENGHSSLDGNGTHNAAVWLIDSWLWILWPSFLAGA